MVDETIIEIARRYLMLLQERGIDVSFGVLFGSCVTGGGKDYSDIDLLVVSPRFDPPRKREEVNLLWRMTADVDTRIEPIACGRRQWEEDDASAIVEIARREGRRIRIPDAA